MRAKRAYSSTYTQRKYSLRGCFACRNHESCPARSCNDPSYYLITTDGRTHQNARRTSRTTAHSKLPPYATYATGHPVLMRAPPRMALQRVGRYAHPALPSVAARLRATRGVPQQSSRHRATSAFGGVEPSPMYRRAALASAAASWSAALITSLAARCVFDVSDLARST